jgi:hypothetical protein
VEKAKFLGAVGFSQLVLARELTIEQIRRIRAEVDTPLEYFIHGALCVAFSGQCYISHADNGRSANRGDCSQACRLPYTLSDGQGRVVAYEKHLLSMKDNDQSRNLEALIDAGIRSFKIEGRYKDMGYVKNITAHYRLLLDEILERRPEFARASSGRTQRAVHAGRRQEFPSRPYRLFRPGPPGGHRRLRFAEVPGRRTGHGHADRRRPLRPDVTNAPLANGDGLNYMNKRTTVGIQANTRAEAGRGRGRPALARVPERAGERPPRPEGRHAGPPQPRPPVGSRADKKSSERKVALHLALSNPPAACA